MECSLGVSIAFLQQPVVQLPRYCLTLVIQFVNVSRAGMRNSHNGPKRLCLSLSFMRFIFGVSHFFRIVVENLIVEEIRVRC